MNRQTKILGFIILCLVWSSTWLFIKLGLETMPPFFSAGFRFVLASLAMYVYSKFLKLRYPRDMQSHLFFLWISLCLFTISYGLVYWGEQYINSGLTSVLFAVMPFYTAILSIKLLPSEHVTTRKMFGILIGISGVTIIFHDQLNLNHSMALWGMVAVLISPVFSALGTLIGKKAVNRYHPAILNTLPLFYAGVTFIIVSLLSESYDTIQLTNMAVFSIFYLALIGTALAFVVYFWMLKHTSAILMSSITFITPPLALIWGWLTLDEHITIHLLIGMVVVFAGIYFVRDKKIKSASMPD